MANGPRVGDQKVVTLDYTLKDRKGDLIDSSDDGGPLAYIHGTHQIIPGLERALSGMGVGDEKDVVVAPADGYGDPDPSGIFDVPRSVFPPEMDLAVGDIFTGENDEGAPVPVRVVEVNEAAIKVDANHPLAGVELHYHIAVRDVRDATEEELEHGHPHGEDDDPHDH